MSTLSHECAGSAAERADRHRLYERAVQCPAAEIDFVERTFQALRGRAARDLREDFCGTAALCREWALRHSENRAWGLDLDGEVLEWAAQRGLEALPAEAGARIALIQADVRTPWSRPLDLILATNFSYWLLRERAVLLDYFRRARTALRTDGLLLLDAYGGYDAFRVLTETRPVSDPECGDFTYVWEQADYDPISGRLLCHIHFHFDDGSRLERAFSYDWRLWTLPEIRELLQEAGFSRVLTYWQGWDDSGEPDGRFVPVETGAPDAGWIAYLSAEP
jgi:SAM-dependent methyltransferase